MSNSPSAVWRCINIAVPIAVIFACFSSTLSGQTFATVSKQCGKCGREVSASAKVGDRCPHCGVRWGRESSHTGDSVSDRSRTDSQTVSLTIGPVHSFVPSVTQIVGSWVFCIVLFTIVGTPVIGLIVARGNAMNYGHMVVGAAISSLCTCVLLVIICWNQVFGV